MQGEGLEQLRLRVALVFFLFKFKYLSVHQNWREEIKFNLQGEGLEQLRLRVALAERESGGGLRAVSNIITNIASIADNLSSR